MPLLPRVGKKARLALVVEGEGQPGRVQERHSLEIYAGGGCRPDLRGAVKLHFTGAHEPVVIALAARGVAALAYPVLVLPQEFQVFRRAVGIGLGELVCWFAHETLACFQFHPELRAGGDGTLLLDAHMAFGVNFVLRLIVAEAIRIHGLAPLAQLDFPLGLDFTILPAAHAVSADEYRGGLVGGIFANERGLRAQLERIVFGMEIEWQD